MRISARRMRNTWVVVLALAVGGGVGAQDTARAPSPVFVGSEAENYLRYLQSLGEIPLHPWSMRGFTDADLRALRVRDGFVPIERQSRKDWHGLTVLATHATTIYNSAFPYGTNDGALWAGRGLTAEVRGGVTGKWGPLRLTLAPTAFWAENKAFALIPVADSLSDYSSGVRSEHSDVPQRFGPNAYARIDPGQSGIRIEGWGANAAFSWANRWWGPMSDFPYVLGNNAAGFPHLYLGTSSPRSIGFARVSASVLYGQLSQSPYSPVTGSETRRFASGMVVAFEPRFFPGLELGFARFFHSAWPDSGLTSEHFTHLFETFIKARIRKTFDPAGPPSEKSSADNQLASVFARWLLPRSGAEVYAEFGREDHNWDVRDLYLEMDHSSSVGFGIRKAWRTAAGVRAIRVESINYQENTLQRHRPQGGAYVHTHMLQGHTQLGELLGTAAGVGNGAASTASYETSSSSSAVNVSWTRAVVLDEDTNDNMSVRHVLRVQRARRTGSRSFSVGLSSVLDLNRQMTTASVMNFRLETSWTRF